MFPSLEEKTMNNYYLQNQERRKFRANARQVNKGEVSFKELVVCVLIAAFSIIGILCVIGMVSAKIID